MPWIALQLRWFTTTCFKNKVLNSEVISIWAFNHNVFVSSGGVGDVTTLWLLVLYTMLGYFNCRRLRRLAQRGCFCISLLTPYKVLFHVAILE